MTAFFLIFSFVLGTLIGSFLNVVALRYNTGMTLGGRSKCFSCNRTLTWSELIPLFSFLFQKGACRKCKSKISWQYPLVEACAGIFFLLIFFFFPPTSIGAAFLTIFYLFITCILLVIALYDIKHKIIPDGLAYTFAIVAFAHLFVSPELTLQIPPVYDMLAGIILAIPFALLWLVSKGEWIGLGDAKLALGIGWTLGLVSGISAIVLSFWIGAVLSVLWMIITFKKYKKHYAIPFGPYLILGMYIVLFCGIRVIDLSIFFNN